ncbi:oxidative stress-induced growth inhibitor 1 isoform X2 [Xenopus tropicalis]|uniref:Oxidative stress-induced growth inhibitor 1 n=1 Tax=Xenopus tropicalis TaxID=8364 RepID=A0A8J1JFG3_XENTR|nr:oxidative stress-induced growth inhibitor 1 isoform X2 [Xenopus tropicalis]
MGSVPEMSVFSTSESVPIPVVIIGNGPSGICMSYLLSGYTPYVKEGAVHPNILLQGKLEECPQVPITEQAIEGSMFTLSHREWMGLPDFPFKDWTRMKRRNVRNDRSTAGDILNYYQYYVKKKNLEANFLSGTVVTSVEGIDEGAQNPFEKDILHRETEHSAHKGKLFRVSGFLKDGCGSKQTFSLYAENVVLATGTYDNPSWLGVQGEDLPFVFHQISALEEAIKMHHIQPRSDPVLIIGAGLTAADAVLLAHHYNLPVIHAFRRRVSDPALIFNQLPQVMYPEYHKVHQMMKEQSVFEGGPYAGYISLPEHHIVSFHCDKKCTFRDKQGQRKVLSISMVLILIGSNPNLCFLPTNGTYLAMDTAQPVNSKSNPMDIDPFTYECIQEKGLYALGPLAGDYFVRFVQGGALAAARSLLKSNKRPP